MSIPVTPTLPRDETLQQLLGATVRVGGATGVAILNGDVRVIVTAWHVVQKEPSRVVIRRGKFSHVTAVLGHDDIFDIAVMGDDPRLDATPLQLLSSESPSAPGDFVHLAGFPAGWHGDLPLLSSGTVAGVDGELWINADATWGHSGGPIGTVIDGVPAVAGIVLGGAGKLRSDLDQLVSSLTASSRRLGTAANADGSGGFGVGTAAGAVTFGDVADTMSKALVALAQFSAAHFRTGYTRAASADQIRKLL